VLVRGRAKGHHRHKADIIVEKALLPQLVESTMADAAGGILSPFWLEATRRSSLISEAPTAWHSPPGCPVFSSPAACPPIFSLQDQAEDPDEPDQLDDDFQDGDELEEEA
jgi:hypothetical protein